MINKIYSSILTTLLLFSTAVFAETTTESIPLDKLQEFVEVIEQVKTYYVEEVSTDELFEHAMSGMVSSLDPYSSYLSEEDFDDLKISTSGKFGGLGLEVTMKDGFVQVIAPIDDTPAAKANIQPGDFIIRIDNKPVNGMSLRDAVTAMRGPEGTPITLTILREDEKKPIEITLKRAIIKVKNIKSSLLEPGYAYVRISHFQDNTSKEMQQAITKLKRESGGQLKGLILDLRNNPGGVLDEAVKVSDSFLDSEHLKYDGVIVYTKSRIEHSTLREKAHGEDILNHAPMVILVNAGSASASEIVAGALQDHKRALIMGDTTFGKGSVQTVIPLKHSKGLKLTTAYYYTPSGHSIQESGIEPDIAFEDEEIVSKIDELEVVKIEDTHELLEEDEQVSEALDVLKTVNAKMRRPR